MSIEKLAEDITVGAEKVAPERVGKYVNRMIRNNLPLGTCPEKRPHNVWKREKVVEALPERLRSSVDPELLK